MTSRHTFRAATLTAAGATLAAAACSKDPVLVGTTAPPTAPFMARYIAVGNSITAGYQSAGINDSTQRRSYARMLAIAAGATFSYPAFTAPGCPPPLVNFLTGIRVGGDTSSTACSLRAPSSITASLNNVAVPGANTFDVVGRGLAPGAPGSLTTGGYSALTALILGGQTQLQRAVQLDPTFATVWIGNNDVLAGALQYAGDSTKATSVANFTNNYSTLINGLVSGSPNLKGGVLIGVVDPTNVPLLIPVAVFTQPIVNGAPNPAYRAVLGLFGVGTRRPLTFQIGADPSCINSAAAITFPALAGLGAAVPLAAPGYIFNCGNTAAQTPNLVTDAERAFYVKQVATYNAYIKAKADSIGWAYLDPNPLFTTLKQQGAIPLFPDLLHPEAPFAVGAGTAQQVRYITNDGVHPSTTAHFVLANALITAINTKYGSIGASIRALVPADTTGL
ncbi:MAG: SGNH/GDSL hydrolase family protein [Candidatus Eremiobacteraeota bacterium]|nr:SGNH/GDSL hydrolase family protein [Candidatus Eremiobacteraeota bacterium]